MSEPDLARVLLVDDIEENLIALEALLRRSPNIEIVMARSGREALEILLVQDVALALLDVNMPEMDGFQLAELMRGTQRTKEVPIVFVTAAHEPARVFQGYELGAVDFLTKPVDPRILKSKVQTLIELYRSKRQLAVQLTELERMQKQLTEVLRMQETFVAAVNHDLRSPLHTISVGVSLLVDDSTEKKDVARRIESAIDRMGGMLDQLYDLARTRVGAGLPLEPKGGDFGQLVQSVVNEAELRKGKGTVQLDTSGDVKGTWDLTRVTRLAANLVTNAITHGDASAPVVVKLDGNDPSVIILAVQNGGVIPSDVLPVIFEPFRRGNAAAKGLGLGLYIVREIASAHGGAVSVTSTVATGTRFEVRLPRHVPFAHAVA
ncbi:MAG TPA: hybrid sensor histidine kinase/response regulator [Kofleriaceae bacterium]|jgi:signal transduction histidine kinase